MEQQDEGDRKQENKRIAEQTLRPASIEPLSYHFLLLNVLVALRQTHLNLAFLCQPNSPPKLHRTRQRAVLIFKVAWRGDQERIM